MGLVLWRFCVGDVARDPKEAFSGNGSAKGAGRWNHAGRRVVYCACSKSVALLEVLVDLPRGDVPRLALFRAEAPDDLRRESIDPNVLPPHWRDTPPPAELKNFGAAWLDRGETAILSVPSVIVPDEPNVLLAPDHPDFARVRIEGPFEFRLDPRFIKRDGAGRT